MEMLRRCARHERFHAMKCCSCTVQESAHLIHSEKSGLGLDRSGLKFCVGKLKLIAVVL